MITGTTRLYAIIGDPIEHVRTPMAFNAHFQAHDIDAVCLPFHIGRDDLVAGWAGFKALRNLDGFIVTAPHKAGAAALCDRLEKDGAHTGVVNVVRREKDGSFSGTLLDGRGFVAGLQRSGISTEGRRAYLAGAGGAGTALAFALASSGIARLSIHNRTAAKAQTLVERVGTAYPGCAVEIGTNNAHGHDLVINATSLGLKPDDAFSFDLESAEKDSVIAEVVMKPDFTPLLLAAQARGHKVHSGTHMLDGQLDLMLSYLGLSAAPAEKTASNH